MALNHEKTKDLLAKYDLPFVPTEMIKKEEEALEVAEDMGYPLVAKISSTEHIHKTDLGGVITDIKEKEELKESLHILFRIRDIEGILIQKQIKGTEMVIGAKRDRIFGPVVMFGLGGIFVEVLRDVSFRLAPFEREEAISMMKEIKGARILDGLRGNSPVDKEKVADMLVKTSQLIEKENIEEVDFNPVIGGEEIYICDAKII